LLLPLVVTGLPDPLVDAELWENEVPAGPDPAPSGSP
jgi:hypothetical protein